MAMTTPSARHRLRCDSPLNSPSQPSASRSSPMCRPPSTSISVGAEPSAVPSATCLFRSAVTSAVTSADRALKPLPARMARAGGTRNRPRWLSTNHRAEHRMRDTRLSAQYSAAGTSLLGTALLGTCTAYVRHDVRHAACGVRYDVETSGSTRASTCVDRGQRSCF